MRPWILAADGRPFPSREAAADRRDQLAAELGAGVAPHVIPHPEGGFAVNCPEANSAAVLNHDGREVPMYPAAETTAIPRAPRTATAAQERRSIPVRLRLSPARRARWGQFCVAVGGVYLAWMPREVLHRVGFQLPASPVLADLVVWYVLLAGVALALASVTRILWYPMARKYLVDHQGVTTTEWCWDRGLRRYRYHLDFEQLRSVYVAQSLFDRLLNIGTVKLIPHSAMERTLTLSDLSAPARLEAEIARRILAAPLRGPRLFRDSAGRS